MWQAVVPENGESKIVADRKTCINCGENKPSSAYGRKPRNPDGLEGSCRECRNAMRRETRQAKILGAQLPRRRQVTEEGPELVGWYRDGLILRPILKGYR